MTAAELRARLAHALQLQQTLGLSTAAALAAAWGQPYTPPRAVRAGVQPGIRRAHPRRRSAGAPLRPLAVRLRQRAMLQPGSPAAR